MSNAPRTRAKQLNLFDLEHFAAVPKLIEDDVRAGADQVVERCDQPGQTAAPGAEVTVYKGTSITVYSSDSPIVEGGRVVRCEKTGCDRPATLVTKWAEGESRRCEQHNKIWPTNEGDGDGGRVH